MFTETLSGGGVSWGWEEERVGIVSGGRGVFGHMKDIWKESVLVPTHFGDDHQWTAHLKDVKGTPSNALRIFPTVKILGEKL